MRLGVFGRQRVALPALRRVQTVDSIGVVLLDQRLLALVHPSRALFVALAGDPLRVREPRFEGSPLELLDRELAFGVGLIKLRFVVPQVLRVPRLQRLTRLADVNDFAKEVAVGVDDRDDGQDDRALGGRRFGEAVLQQRHPLLEGTPVPDALPRTAGSLLRGCHGVLLAAVRICVPRGRSL